MDQFHREPILMSLPQDVARQRLECSVERRTVGVEGVSESVVREVIISTEKPVRSGGGIARAGGAQLSAYLRNPVVMWAHNYREPPVAKATSLSVEPGVGISARFEFPEPGLYPLADTVRRLWDAGFINAASIGFMPLEWELVPDPESSVPPDKQDRFDKIPVFNKWELYEFSLVAVPRDREALRRALDVETQNLASVRGERMLAGLDLQRFLDGLRAVREALCLK